MGQEQRGQVKRDMQLGKERGKQDAQRAKQEAEQRTGDSDGRTESTAAYRPAT
jgi:hypothetical protein